MTLSKLVKRSLKKKFNAELKYPKQSIFSHVEMIVVIFTVQTKNIVHHQKMVSKFIVLYFYVFSSFQLEAILLGCEGVKHILLRACFKKNNTARLV